jgi:hypothetical protein
LSDAAFRARYAPEIDNLRTAVAWSFDLTATAKPHRARRIFAATVGELVALHGSRNAHAASVETPRAVRPRRLRPLCGWDFLWSIHIEGPGNHHAAQAVDLYRGRIRCAWAVPRRTRRRSNRPTDDGAEPALLEARSLLERSGRQRMLAMSQLIALLHQCVAGRTRRSASRRLR